MGAKFTIIGAGAVGATIGYTLSMESFTTEILFIDVDKDKAEGEAMDILQSTAYRDPIVVRSGSYEDAKGSDIVIITSGKARKPGMTRLDLAKSNVEIIRSVASQIAPVCPFAKYIIVSNPVDILTYVFMKESGIPEAQIIGSGTQLDTARLRSLLAKECSVSQMSVNAYIFGEHGDSAFIPWSVAEIAGLPVPEYYKSYGPQEQRGFDEDEILDYVRKSGSVIIADKGATFYAIALSVVKLIRMLLSSDETVTMVSTMLHGEYGISDVALSISCLIGPYGVEKRLQLHLTDDEVAKLQASAAKLREMLDEIYAEQ